MKGVLMMLLHQSVLLLLQGWQACVDSVKDLVDKEAGSSSSSSSSGGGGSGSSSSSSGGNNHAVVEHCADVVRVLCCCCWVAADVAVVLANCTVINIHIWGELCLFKCIRLEQIPAVGQAATAATPAVLRLTPPPTTLNPAWWCADCSLCGVFLCCAVLCCALCCVVLTDGAPV